MYLVLGAQYESWSDPIAVILVVPTALIGIIIAQALRASRWTYTRRSDWC